MIDWHHEMTEFNRRNEGAFPTFHQPEEMLCYLYGYLRSINKVAEVMVVGYIGARTALVKSGVKMQAKGRPNKGQLIDMWG